MLLVFRITQNWIYEKYCTNMTLPCILKVYTTLYHLLHLLPQVQGTCTMDLLVIYSGCTITLHVRYIKTE